MGILETVPAELPAEGGAVENSDLRKGFLLAPFRSPKKQEKCGELGPLPGRWHGVHAHLAPEAAAPVPSIWDCSWGSALATAAWQSWGSEAISSNTLDLHRKTEAQRGARICSRPQQRQVWNVT